MQVLERCYGKIEASLLTFDENEVALRLGVCRGYTNEQIQKCKDILLSKTDCRYTAVRVAVKVTDNKVEMGNITAESSSLALNLNQCKECYIMAVTLGQGVDYLLKRLSVSSLGEYYITDALASALADTAADKTEDILLKDKKRRPRFSPGYADLKLEIQSDVLALLGAQTTIGVTLSKAYLMTPQKTITAIVGIKD